MSSTDFIAITGASEAQAKRFLQQNNNQLEAALSAFFDANEAPAVSRSGRGQRR
jgi:hypothetical protein